MEAAVLAYVSQTMSLVLILSMPPIVVASVVGLALSLFQAITQLQEQTLTFGVKLIAVVVTLFLTAGWFGAEILRFAGEVFDKFYLI